MAKSKQEYPKSDARRYLEPGPVVLISSRWQGQDNIMTLGWHTILEFTRSLWGAMISSGNHSHRMIRESGECVVNLPTAYMIDSVSRIGNCDGDSVDKFDEFGLTKTKSVEVGAPGIAEFHASFECKLHDDSLVSSRNFFIFEIVKAHVANRPAHPETLHYIGDGSFVTAGKVVSRKSLFTKVTEWPKHCPTRAMSCLSASREIGNFFGVRRRAGGVAWVLNTEGTFGSGCRNGAIKRSRSSPFNAAVSACMSMCAPWSDHRICCFLTTNCSGSGVATQVRTVFPRAFDTSGFSERMPGCCGHGDCQAELQCRRSGLPSVRADLSSYRVRDVQ